MLSVTMSDSVNVDGIYFSVYIVDGKKYLITRDQSGIAIIEHKPSQLDNKDNKKR